MSLLPTPEIPLTIEIHEELLTAVQAQPVSVVSRNNPLPPSAGTFEFVGAIEKVQLAWLTVNVCPPAVIVPERGFSGLDAILNEIFPLPVPALPAVMVIQGTLLTAVQLHSEKVVKENPPVETAGGTFELVGAIEKEQPDPWLIVNTRPAAAIVPVRAGPLVG